MFSRRDSERERVLSDYSALSATDYSDSESAAYDSDALAAAAPGGGGAQRVQRGAQRGAQQGAQQGLHNQRRNNKLNKLPGPSAFVLLLCVLGSLVNGFFLNVRGPCVDDLAARAGVQRAQVGYFFIASGVGGVAASLPAGKLIDWMGNPMVPFAAGLFLRAASCFALPYVSSLWLLVLVGAVQGLTLPLVGVSLRAAVLWMYEEDATPKLNFVMAAFGAGSTIAPLVYDGFAALENGSSAPLDWTFWGLAAASALLGGCALCVDRRLFRPSRGASQPSPQRRQRQQHHQHQRQQPWSEAADNNEHSSSAHDTSFASSAAGQREPMSWRDEMVFLGILNVYMLVSVGIEGTLGNWLYTLAGGNTSSGFSQATWVNTGLWGTFTLSRIFLVVVTRFKQEHVLYSAHTLCFAGTLCGIFALQHAREEEGGDETNTLPPVLPTWALWTLTVSFGIGIAPSFPNVIGLANRLYPGTFSGVTQSIFGISANAGNGALPGISGLLAGMPSIGPVSYVAVPLVGVVVMQFLLWALICVAPRGPEGEDERDDGRERRESHLSNYSHRSSSLEN